MRNSCPQLRAKAERDRKREAEMRRREERERVREERWARQEERDREYKIKKGELAVGDGGKTIPMWAFSGR